MQKYIDVIPLGGLGEFGMNCTAVRSGDDMVVIDAGMAFPRGDSDYELGVRVIVPELDFFYRHRDILRGLVLTHGHEDHIGSVPFLLDEIDLPVYGSRLTLGMVRAKLEERGILEKAELHEIQPGSKLSFGEIEIETIRVTHSFPESYCFAIQTPVGTLIWTGDFKFDQTPIDGELSDIHRLAAHGDHGVLALFSDSTNSPTPGLAPSESSIDESLKTIFQKSNGRIIASTFSSSIHRIQVFVDLAREFNRKVVAAGRSILNSTRIAQETGYLRRASDIFVDPGEARQMDPSEVVILAAGSQGEPFSALTRLAIDQYKKMGVEEGDVVILSARFIPGNEKAIHRMIDHFYRRGARVYDPNHFSIHASGHGYREDLKLMMALTKPKYFVPIHGDYMNLKIHARIAEKQGIPADNVRLIENGAVFRLSARQAEVVEQLSVGRRFIDDGIMEEVHEVVLRDRRYLSEDGFVVVILRMDRITGQLIGEPELVSRGFVLMDESESLMKDTERIIKETVRSSSLEEKQDEELFNEILRKKLWRFLRKETGKRPLILSKTIEI